MNAAQHTPGPWSIKRINNYAVAIVGGVTRAYVNGSAQDQLFMPCGVALDNGGDAAREANALLCCAALELLAALVKAIEDSEEVLAARIARLGENYRPLTLKAMREDIAKGRAAIAKATGSTT